MPLNKETYTHIKISLLYLYSMKQKKQNDQFDLMAYQPLWVILCQRDLCETAVKLYNP